MALELSSDVPCGSSSHPVSMTLMPWGTVVMSSLCLLLPESAQRLAGSTCMQHREALHLSAQQALYGDGRVDVPAFLEAQAAEAVRDFLTRLRKQRAELVEAILQDWDAHWTEGEVKLRAALEADAPGVRWAAAIVAGERAAIGLVPELMHASEDEDLGVQLAAVRALAQIADARAAPILCRWLGEKRLIPEIRQQIARALGEIGSAEAVEPLIQALRDEDWWVRTAAAKALGQIGDARAVEPLIQALRDKGKWVRTAAAKALGQIGDARAVEPLIQALRDWDESVRTAAAEALVKIGDARAVEPLIQALRDGWVRTAAAEALGQIRAARAVGPLIQALRDEDWRVRTAAAEELGRIGDARAVEPLIQALRDENESVRTAAAEALGMGLMRFLIGRRIIHRRYGRGVIEKIFRERPPAVVVRLENPSGPESLQVVSLAEDFSLE
ncbi:Phycocyanobilin lyase subunit alpha [bacterium HR08]|nr:Phycocyanobilin lyase subunit alpha [bacterium HR08]